VVESVLADRERLRRGRWPAPPEELPAPAPEESLEECERAVCRSALLGGFAVLDEADRDLLAGLFLEGRTLTELASRRGVEVSTVGRARDRTLSRLHQATVAALVREGGFGRVAARALLARFSGELRRIDLDLGSLLRPRTRPPEPAAAAAEPDPGRESQGCLVPEMR